MWTKRNSLICPRQTINAEKILRKCKNRDLSDTMVDIIHNCRGHLNSNLNLFNVSFGIPVFPNYAVRVSDMPTPFRVRIQYFYLFYFGLVIFEGVLRKWIRLAPFDLFYFFRDVISFLYLVWILFSKAQHSRIPQLFYLVVFLITSIAFVQVLNGQIELNVAIFGLRNMFAPFVIAFISISTNTRDILRDSIIRLCIASIYVEAPLALFQALSPRDSFINFTTWGQASSMVTSGDQVRPIGTFTSTLGFSYYLVLCTAVLFLTSFSHKYRSTKVQRNYPYMVAIAVAISGSRTVLFAVILIALLSVLTSRKLFNSKIRFRFSAISIATFIFAYFADSILSVIDAFIFRLRYQTEGGGGTLKRISEAIFGYTIDFQFIGEGIGKYHQSGIALGSANFWIENEIPRWIMELGLLGFFLVILRQIWAFRLLILASNTRSGYFHENRALIFALFPLLLFSGITTQPSVQGIASCLIPFAFRMRNLE